MNINVSKIKNIIYYVPIFSLMLLIIFDLFFSVIGFLFFILLIYIYVILFLAKKKKVSISFICEINPLTLFVIFIGFWGLYATILMNWEIDSRHTRHHYEVIILGIMMILFFLFIFRKKESFKALYLIWGFSLLISIIIGWWEYFSGNNLIDLDNRFENVITVNYYNPNNYSFILSISLPIVLFWIQELNIFYKILGIGMLFSIFYFTYVNGSRISLFITLIVIILFLFSLVRKNKKMLLLFVLILSFWIYNYFYLIIDSIEKINTIDAADESYNIRSFLYSSALNIFKSHPFGVGPGMAEYYMPVIGFNIHSFWLEILVNYGFIIFIGISLFFTYTIIKLYKLKNFTSELKPILWSILIFIPTSNAPSSVFTFGITWFIFSIMFVSIQYIDRMKQLNEY